MFGETSTTPLAWYFGAQGQPANHVSVEIQCVDLTTDRCFEQSRLLALAASLASRMSRSVRVIRPSATAR